MKRVLIDPIPPGGSRVEPSEEERRHLQDVRRSKLGEHLEVIDGKGGLALAEVVALERNRMVLEIKNHLDERRESPLQLKLGLAIPSQLSTFDEMLPGLVQLGVNEIHLFPSEWGGRLKKDGAKYEARLQSICLQALKQCGRLILPKLIFPKSFEETLATFKEQAEQTLMFHPAEEKPSLPPNLLSLGLLVGPEGGFTDDEVEAAKATGVVLQGLGPRILKMETAAIGACYWAQSRFGDF